MSAGQKPGRLSCADAPRDSSLQSTDAKVLAGTRALDGTLGSADAVSAAGNNGKRSLTTFVRVAVALLLTSAGFKTYAIFTEPYFADSILGSPLWMVGLVECEILLGLWLLSGVALRFAWHVALAAFIGFAGVNIYLLATGATTCGCFGTVETHPWVMLGIDLAVLGALFIWRPTANASLTSVPNSGILRHFASVGGLFAITLGFFATWSVLQHGSLLEGVMALRGEVISVDPVNLNVGEHALGSSRRFTITLRNHSDAPVRIIGGTASCKCIANQALPVTIPAKGDLELSFVVSFTGKQGAFRQQFTLVSDSPIQPHIIGRVFGVSSPVNEAD